MERPDGSLANRFVTVLGTPVRDLDVAVRGNERVLAARLSDARFFWTEDRKVPLDRRAESLKDVVFQAKLGTIHEKSERLVALCEQLAPAFGADPALARRAAVLAKADLVTQMVGEFPDLQGVMGRYYALAQGEPAAVADAILEHYQPRGAADGLPSSAVGATVAVMDRLDTLVGCLGAGLKPKGGGDPFGLRRAALGLLRILIERDLTVSLSAWVAAAAALHTRVTPDQAEVVAFVLERLRGLLGEAHPGEIVNAVMAAGGDDPMDLTARVRALAAFAQGPEYAALATTFRRMNILKQGTAIPAEIPVAGLVEAADRALLLAFQATAAKVEGRCERRDYAAALGELAALRPPVDAFFTDVKVMADDPAVRDARLALLAAVDRLFRRVADFKLIAG
jgi:glycyl-tRNA synthetase beta chain